MESIKLSDRYTIYKGKYNQEFPISEFLKYVEINEKLVIPTNNNSTWIEIETPCFDSINNQVKKNIETISNSKITDYSKHNWVYTQREGFDMEWMHQHILVHPGSRSNILTDYTFTFYLQIPNDMMGDEGHIVFETEDKKRHKFLPEVGDIFIFDADIRHTAIPTPNCKTKRIVYAGSICVDIHNQDNKKKSIL